MKNIFRFLSFVIVNLCIFYIGGCGSDDSDDEPANSSPIVDSFIVPTEFSPGEIIEFRVIAYDKDGRPIELYMGSGWRKTERNNGDKCKMDSP